MKLLFDTHTFMWWDSELDKLPARVQDLCFHPESQLVLSVVSTWEIQVKVQLGKLNLVRPLVEIVADQRKTNQVVLLPVQYEHVLELDNLPFRDTPHALKGRRLLVSN